MFVEWWNQGEYKILNDKIKLVKLTFKRKPTFLVK
jgi:hypothetical protein